MKLALNVDHQIQLI